MTRIFTFSARVFFCSQFEIIANVQLAANDMVFMVEDQNEIPNFIHEYILFMVTIVAYAGVTPHTNEPNSEMTWAAPHNVNCAVSSVRP